MECGFFKSPPVNNSPADHLFSVFSTDVLLNFFFGFRSFVVLDLGLLMCLFSFLLPIFSSRPGDIPPSCPFLERLCQWTLGPESGRLLLVSAVERATSLSPPSPYSYCDADLILSNESILFFVPLAGYSPQKLSVWSFFTNSYQSNGIFSFPPLFSPPIFFFLIDHALDSGLSWSLSSFFFSRSPMDVPSEPSHR